MNIKKITSVTSAFIICLTMSGCSKIKGEDIDVAAKLAVVTETKNEDEVGFESAEYISNTYKQKNATGLSNDIVEHIVLPENFADKKAETEKIMNSIKEDKELKAVVFTEKNSGMMEYIKDLKKERKDIITLSADMNASDKELIENIDLNYVSAKGDNMDDTVQLAKEMGAEAFIAYYTDEDMKSKDRKEGFRTLEEECEEQQIELVKVNIQSGSDKYAMRKFISEDINKQIEKYGNDINLYGTNPDIDEVILKRGIKNKLIIAEVSDKCMMQELSEMFRIYRRSWDRGNYRGSSKYISDRTVKYEMNRRLGGIIMPDNIFTVYAATDIALALIEGGLDVESAYNSYFIERNINEKEGITAGFENVIEGVPSLKSVSVDQIIY